ncbi:MAG: RHS repeat protein [Clostridium sp.]|nr:RHS repeat protein [Clostridium sp.]
MRRKVILVLTMTVANYLCGLLIGTFTVDNPSCVYAQAQGVQYDYDSLGRVSSARYPNGTEVKFEYDANGNLLRSEVTKGQQAPDSSEEDGGNQGTAGENGGTPGGTTGESGSASSEGNTGESGSNQGSTGENDGNTSGDSQQNGGTVSADGGQGEAQGVTGPAAYTSEDIKNYNQFKKRKPVIKSLKKTQSKKKYYLKIKIKQINKRGIYGETGYQIKYATNSRFKKAKTVKADRSRKGTVTSKKWKVKKGKTYYVKVRAVMKTKTGKTIYSKYSKTKKLKVE